jgi:hypothetical protein
MDAVLVQDLPDPSRYGHKIQIPRDGNMNRSDDLSFRKLPNVEFMQIFNTGDCKD